MPNTQVGDMHVCVSCVWGVPGAHTCILDENRMLPLEAKAEIWSDVIQVRSLALLKTRTPRSNAYYE